MKRNNKDLYERIMRNVSKQVKKALNEMESSLDYLPKPDVDYTEDNTEPSIYQQLVDACKDTPEIYIEKSYNSRYVATVSFTNGFYKLLDKISGIGSDGETWINISSKLSATIVAIGGQTGRRYSASYGKFKNVQQLADALKASVENYRKYMPIDLDNIKISNNVNDIINKLKNTHVNFNLNVDDEELTEDFIDTLLPKFYIYDRIYENSKSKAPYGYYFVRNPNNTDFNVIGKQVQYDLQTNAKLCVCIKIDKYEDSYFEKRTCNQLIKLQHKCMDYIHKNYKILFDDDSENDLRHCFFDEGSYYEVNLYGYGENIINLIQKAIDIVNGYEQFINDNFSKYIK